MQEIKGLVILGAGVFAEEVADLAQESTDLAVVAYIEGKDSSKVGQASNGLPILWVEDIAELTASHVGIGAMGTTRRKEFIEQAASMGLTFIRLSHPSSQCSDLAEIGVGTLLSRGCIVSARTRIGCHVIVNRGCLIGHHVEIGSYSTLSPGANIAGGVRIGQSVYVGMGAIVLNDVSIGDHSVVGAGAVVTRDVPPHVQVVGIPACITKENIEGL